MLSDRTIVAFDCISWLNANIRGSQCYDLVVKPLYYDYFSIFSRAVIKTTPPPPRPPAYFFMSFSASTGLFFNVVDEKFQYSKYRLI